MLTATVGVATGVGVGVPGAVTVVVPPHDAATSAPHTTGKPIIR